MKRNLVVSVVAIAALIAAAVFLALNPSANGAGSTTKSQVTFTLMASRMGYNGPYVAGLVTLSTLLGMASLPLALGLLRRL